ncbi:MAG: non-ribosomal peptide synthetase [Bacteroidales bacterium]|jgi:amino acid adenylation domain-containing protein|nr:non-ribosomal peptide synthetase [Bacteroidales bacterium]
MVWLEFMEEAMRVPDVARIIFNNMEIKNIETTVNIYAGFLLSRGIDYEKSIAIILDRTPECIYTILAAIKIGSPFLLVDKSLPPKRIRFMLKNSGINDIITEKEYKDDFADNIVFIEDTKDTLLSEIVVKNKNNIIYLMYTSGSTGNPKGVEIRRESFFAFIDGVSKIIDFSKNKRIACLTSISFDIFFLESIMSIYKGLTVILANEDECVNPRLLSRLIATNKAEMIQVTPSKMQLLYNFDNTLACLAGLSEIIIGGEQLHSKLLTRLQQKTKAKIYNMYGPTETTIWSSISDITNKKVIDIGNPIDGTQLYIMNERLEILPEGDIGEICIAGKGLAKGYINNPLLTEEKFVTLNSLHDRAYRTGDYGKFENGVFFFIGRKDNQIKIRGFRIELEEIEKVLVAFDNIEQAAAIYLNQEDYIEMLIVFYIGKINFDNNILKEHMREYLPYYMIPSVFIKLEQFPYTKSGKIDRKEIRNIYVKYYLSPSKNNISFDSKELKLDDEIFNTIKENINENIRDLPPNSDFLSLGLDSITYIKLIIALEEKFNFEFEEDMLVITSFQNIDSMIQYVKQRLSVI